MIGSSFLTGGVNLITLILLVPAIVQATCPHEDTSLKRWSDTATWETNLVPGESHDVVISQPILLDGVTDRLASVTIVSGGKLVFDPTVDRAKLISDFVDIGNEGEMHIGSTDCKFDGQAEILLTGSMIASDNAEDVDESDEHVGDPDFGRKYVGVRAGGTLEIHGKDKKSWTKLAETLVPKEVLFENVDQPNTNGVVFYEFDRQSGEKLSGPKLVRDNLKQLRRYLQELSASSVVVMASRGANFNGQPFKLYQNLDSFMDELEGENFLNNAATIDLRESWTSPYDSWIYMIDRKDDGTVEIFSAMDNNDDTKTLATTELSATINGILYRVKNVVPSEANSKWGNNGARIDLKLVAAENYDIYELKLADDVSSWQPGDKLVIASTDYNFNQVEEVEIVSVSGDLVTVRGELEYTHFGEVYETVDMRGEVGLLTRNVLIHGEMGECPEGGVPSDACKLGFDNFGGNTMALRGFKKYNIEGAELTNMGQMTILGRYPIHFHMCHNTTENGEPNPVIQSNSIHHCFSRCVTIHGTHGVLVKDNVGHDTYGHCFFLEDGGEQDNTFDGNLGLTTRKGFLTPTDNKPTTFWITSPLTTVINNVAGGADFDNGVGYWFLFPDAPVGPSKGLGFFKFKEAKSTTITRFDNNVAHSCGEFGLACNKRLAPDHGFVSCSTYDPRVTPNDFKNSDLAPAIFTRFTGFKNKNIHVKMRSTGSRLIDFKLADGKTAVMFNRNMISGYQMIQDSVIIAESPNLGKPAVIKVKNENGNWVKKTLERSIPSNDKFIRGIYLDSEGPVHVHNVRFLGYKTDERKTACAIEFRDNFIFGMGPTSSVKGLEFDFEEPEALRICHKNEIVGPDETAMTFKDLDGTLTGGAGLNVVSTDDYLHEGLDCEARPLWNMTVCDGNFIRFYLFPKPESNRATFITKAGDNVKTNGRKKVSYTVRSDVTPVLHWYEASMKDYTIRMMGVKKGFPVTVGICLPQGAEQYPVQDFLDFSYLDHKHDDSDVIPADSMDDLAQDATGKNAFLDTATGILYVKFIEVDERGEDDLGDCPGSLLVNKGCPFVSLNFKNLENIDFNQADCTAR